MRHRLPFKNDNNLYPADIFAITRNNIRSKSKTGLPPSPNLYKISPERDYRHIDDTRTVDWNIRPDEKAINRLIDKSHNNQRLKACKHCFG